MRSSYEILESLTCDFAAGGRLPGSDAGIIRRGGGKADGVKREAGREAGRWRSFELSASSFELKLVRAAERHLARTLWKM